MKVEDIARAIEAFAPLSLQESYDNSGLVVGRPCDEVRKVLLAVDVTEEVIDEAVREGAGMIVTHHPIVFHAVKRFNSASVVERCVERAIRERIALYACHTNLDSAPQGMSWRLARMIGVGDLAVLQPAGDGVGFGVVGELAEPMPVREFLLKVKRTLRAEVVRHGCIARDEVRRVAVCTGAGGSLTEDARRAGADVYVTADLRYNDFFEAWGEMTIADVGHFESEYCAIDILYDVICEKFSTFAVRKSVCSRNPIGYITEI